MTIVTESVLAISRSATRPTSVSSLSVLSCDAAVGSSSAPVTVALFVLVGLILAGTVIVYVAYPHRGEELPKVPWLGDVMGKAVEQLPTLDNTAEAGEGPERGETSPLAESFAPADGKVDAASSVGQHRR